MSVNNASEQTGAKRYGRETADFEPSRGSDSNKAGTFQAVIVVDDVTARSLKETPTEEIRTATTLS
jgi:hypothetical protein